jgi:hypothetical protein
MQIMESAVQVYHNDFGFIYYSSTGLTHNPKSMGEDIQWINI